MAVAPQLLRFVEDELGRAPALIERATAGTLQLLREPREAGLTASERGLHFVLVEALQGGAARYQATFVAALREGVMQELHAQQDEPGGPDAAGAGLELMDESRVEVDIEISRAMQIIDSTAEWELRELQTFTSALCGQQHVSAESNPLRPLVYATALWKAACAIALVPAQQTVLLRLSSGVAAGLLRNAWAAASSRLEAQGIEPSIYRTVLLAPGSVPSRTPATAVPTGTIGELLRRMPGAALGNAAFGQDVDAVAGGIADTRVVELLARVFAAIQADTRITGACRAVIARLQVAALRVATQDRAMLESAEHPVWQVMDRIAHASAGYPQNDDPRQAALLRFCEAIAEEISRTPNADTTTFRRAATRIDAFLAEQRQWQLREAEASVGALQRAERREVLEQHLSQRLTEQMGRLRTTPEIRRFVTGAWARVLAEAMLRFGEEVEPTPSYMMAVDDLLWSLQTPDHPQSRQRLLALLPGLLQRLRAGMALIDLPAAEQQAVLDQLMVVHTEALRPGTRPGNETLTPEQIVQRMRDEVVPDAPAQRPFGDSVIDLASLDTVPADFLHTQPAGDSAEATAGRIDAFAPGLRQRIFLQGRWSCVQLLWRSDQGQYFLYAGERPGRMHSITRRALERLDAAGLVQPLERQPLVQRTLDALQNQLSPAA